MSYDSIIIGAGQNGLAAAITLARAGQSVLVLERQEQPGGMVSSVEIAPGVTGSRIAHLLTGAGAAGLAPLKLHEYGLTYARKSLATVSLDPAGRHVVIAGDGSSARFADGDPHPDSAAFVALRQRLARFATPLATLMQKPPPSLSGIDWREAASLAKLAFGIRRMGKGEAREFLRVLLSNAYDTILDEIEDGPLAGAFGLDAVLGGHVGPRAPGTVLSLMYRLIEGGERHLPRGGMASVTRSMVTAAGVAGVDLRCGLGVAEIMVDGDRATGVRLVDGTILTANTVLSSLDPKTTITLSGVTHFDAEMVRRVRNIRAKGCTAKVNLALSSQPAITGLPQDLHAARLVYAPSLAATERAFNPAKYGEMPTDPLLEITLPSLSDDSLCSDGQHVLSAVVQYVPRDLKDGWDDAARDTLAKTVIDSLDRFMPGLGASVIARDVLTPADIEAQTGAPGGHWHHGEMITDQMLMLRPAAGIERYALPVGGLYLCGASTHPGGDVTGINGSNAAHVVLDQCRRRAAA